MAKKLETPSSSFDATNFVSLELLTFHQKASLRAVSPAISSSISSQEIFVTAISVKVGLCLRNGLLENICSLVLGEVDYFVVLLGTR